MKTLLLIGALMLTLSGVGKTEDCLCQCQQEPVSYPVYTPYVPYPSYPAYSPYGYYPIYPVSPIYGGTPAQAAITGFAQGLTQYLQAKQAKQYQLELIRAQQGGQQ